MLDKKAAQNVALIVDGKNSSAEFIKDTLKKAGASVYEDVLFIKPSLFGKVKDTEKAEIMEWLKKVVENLQ